MTVSDVASLLGITRQAVEKRRKAGKLIALSAGKRGYAYLQWQVSSDGVLLPGLEEVFGDLEEHSAMARSIVMLSPTIRLNGQRPVDMIRRGRIDDARRRRTLSMEQRDAARPGDHPGPPADLADLPLPIREVNHEWV